MQNRQLPTKYAVLFKHSHGWTYLKMTDSSDEARAYISERATIYKPAFKFAIRPCKVTMLLPDSMARDFK